MRNLLFRIVEGFGGKDFSNNFIAKAFLVFVSAFFSKLSLFLAVVEDGGHVLARGAAGRIVQDPEHL